MKPEQLENWKQTRTHGALRYILLRGLLVCGLPLALTSALLMRHAGIDAVFIGLAALLWGLGGSFIGIAMWTVQERLYRKARGTGA